MMESDILVLGVGNLILCDEGIGIHAVNEFSKRNTHKRVDTLDGGTGGISMIETLQNYKHIIMIDATLDNLEEGTIRRITPRYASDYPILMSAHEIGIKEMVDAMALTGYTPEIELVVISIKDIRKVGIALSPKAASTIPAIITVINTIIGEIRNRGI